MTPCPEPIPERHPRPHQAQPAIFYLPAKHNKATAAKLEAQAEQQMSKLASSVLHKADPLDGLDLTNEPPPAAPPAAAPAAAAAEDGGEEGGEKVEGDAADADAEMDAEAAKSEAEAEGKADEKEEPQPVEDEEVVEPMMAGTELGDMLED